MVVSKTIKEIDTKNSQANFGATKSKTAPSRRHKSKDFVGETKQKEDLKTLEAIFFVSGRFLNMQELVSLTNLNPVIIKELIENLQERYDKQESAIEIIEKHSMWKMDVRQECSHIINKLATGSSEFSKAEQETLAIIAFKQPIKQSVIIKIRGNKAYEHIKKFAELDLIKKKRIGHTYELSLSDEFYDYFNVKNSEKGIFDRDQDSESSDESWHVKDSDDELQESLKTELTEE